MLFVRNQMFHRTVSKRPGTGAVLFVACLAGGLLGVSLAIPFLRSLPATATETQPLGLAKLEGFSPADNVRALAGLIAATLGGSILFSWLQRRAGWNWTQYRLAWAGTAAGLLAAADGASVLAVVLTAGAWSAVGYLVEAGQIGRPRGRSIAMSIAHALIAWVFLTPEVGVLLGSPSTLALILLPLSLVMTGFLEKNNTSGSEYFATTAMVAPLALIRPLPFGIRLGGAVVAYLLPLMASRFLNRPATLAVMRRLTTYVVLPGALIVLTATAFLRAPHVGDLFEDGHGLLPAAEYMRGELPYVDLVPGHGLVTDGGMQLVSLRLFGDSYGGLRTGDRALGLAFWPLIYFMGLAATARPHIAFGSALILLALFPQLYFLRILFALATLAIAFLAIRRARRWLWLVTGTAAIAGVLFAVEFGVYTALATCAAALVSRGSRSRNIGGLIVGALAMTAVVAGSFAFLGILPAFAESTLRHIPALLPAYAAGMPPPPLSAGVSPFHTRVLEGSQIETFLFYLLLLGALLILGLGVSRARALGSSGRPLMVIAAWYVAATMSVVERSHINYVLFVAPLGIVLAYRWFGGALDLRGRRFLLAAVLVVGFVVLRPFDVTRGLAGWLGEIRVPAIYKPLANPPRAGGALFKEGDVQTVEMIGRALTQAGLRQDQTWFDFANLPALYYLFDRDCPIRYYEVPFFQDPARQQEVIAALDANPSVRLAILPASGSTAYAIDGIPNELRAPAVFDYIRRRFRPLLTDNAVEVWIRSDG